MLQIRSEVMSVTHARSGSALSAFVHPYFRMKETEGREASSISLARFVGQSIRSAAKHRSQRPMHLAAAPNQHAWIADLAQRRLRALERQES